LDHRSLITESLISLTKKQQQLRKNPVITGQNTPISQTEMINIKTKEFGIKKFFDFEGDRKKMQSFVL
jgi:hypothetical protein